MYKESTPANKNNPNDKKISRREFLQGALAAISGAAGAAAYKGVEKAFFESESEKVALAKKELERMYALEKSLNHLRSELQPLFKAGNEFVEMYDYFKENGVLDKVITYMRRDAFLYKAALIELKELLIKGRNVSSDAVKLVLDYRNAKAGRFKSRKIRIIGIGPDYQKTSNSSPFFTNPDVGTFILGRNAREAMLKITLSRSAGIMVDRDNLSKSLRFAGLKYTDSKTLENILKKWGFSNISFTKDSTALNVLSSGDMDLADRFSDVVRGFVIDTYNIDRSIELSLAILNQIKEWNRLYLTIVTSDNQGEIIDAIKKTEEIFNLPSIYSREEIIEFLEKRIKIVSEKKLGDSYRRTLEELESEYHGILQDIESLTKILQHARKALLDK